MSKYKALVIFGAVLLFAWLLIGRNKGIVVPVTEINQSDIVRVISAVGRVRALDQVTMRSLVPGKISELSKDDGSPIALGEVIVKIDDEIAVQSLKQIQAQLTFEHRNFEQKKKEKERAEKLYAAKAVSVQAFEITQVAERESAQNIARLTAATAEASRQLKEYTISAPFDGFIKRRLVDVGQAISVTTDLFEVVRNNAVDIECEIDETFIDKISVGRRVSWRPSGINAQTYEGVINYISPTVDPRTGGFVVRIDATQMQGTAENGPTRPTLRPGQSVDVNIVVERLLSQLLVPRKALVRTSGETYVWAVTDSRAKKSLVTVDDWPEGDIAITSGLQAGALVALSPEGLTEGQRVSPVKYAF
jgi:membrane fusion protein (multidrug efflux system)